MGWPLQSPGEWKECDAGSRGASVQRSGQLLLDAPRERRLDVAGVSGGHRFDQQDPALLLGNWIGALLYLFVRRPQRKAETGR